MTESQKAKVQNYGLIFLFVIIFAAVVYVLTVVCSPIKYVTAQEYLSFKCVYYNEQISYDDIVDCEFVEDYRSKKVKAFGGGSKELGYYRNEDFGRHYRATFTQNKHTFIIIKKQDGSVVVVNQKTTKLTEKMYNNIIKAIEGYSA